MLKNHHAGDGCEIISDWSLPDCVDMLVSNHLNFCYFIKTLAVSWLASVVVVLLLNTG